MFYEEVFRELNKKKVRYLVVGGGAVVLHGVVRMTAGLDLFVDLERKNLLKFVEVLTSLGYRSKIPVEVSDFSDKSKREKWRKEKDMVVFSFYHLKRHQDHIDVFVYEPIRFQVAYKNRAVISAGRIKIQVISIKHLTKMKAIAGRPQDIADIEALKEVRMLRKRNEKRKVKKGFAFKPDIEYIKETMDMPVRSKLEWLEESNSFVYKALSKRKIKRWERIKKGEV